MIIISNPNIIIGGVSQEDLKQWAQANTVYEINVGSYGEAEQIGGVTFENNVLCIKRVPQNIPITQQADGIIKIGGNQ